MKKPEYSTPLLVSLWPNVTSIDLSYCRNITDAAVIRLAAQCPGLIHVFLHRCRNLTDAAVAQLAAMYPALSLHR